MARELLFSVTIRDCDVDTFCTGGNGGQHRNATKNGVRVTHRASGAVAEHRDGRDQFRNKQAAFRKMAESKTFQAWLRIETARRSGMPTIHRQVDEAMDPSKIRIEGGDGKGNWVRLP